MDDKNKNKNELFVITGGGSEQGPGKSAKPRSAVRNRASFPRQLSKTVDLVNQITRQWLQARAEEVFTQVDDSLFSLAEKAHQQDEQDRLFLAIRTLRVALSDLVNCFCDGVEARFHAPRNDSPGEEVPLNAVSSKSLSLVNNDDLEQQVVIRTIVSNVKRDHAEGITALSLRLDTLLPHKIYDENLPLGPAAVCAVFAEALEELDVSLRARMTVFKKFELHLASRLGELYDACNRSLIEQGVLPTIENPLRHQRGRNAASTQSASTAQPASPTRDPAGAAFAHGASESGAFEAGSASVGSGAGSFPPGLMAAGMGIAPMATPTLLQHLGQLQVAPPAQSAVTGQILDVSSMLEERLVASRQAASLHELDSEVIRLVDMLFSFMLEDRNLAEPVKVQLIRLQLPMLKLAVADKAFFSKSGHPARRLLNELADAAIGWQPGENFLNDPLYREVCTIVEGVLAEYDQDEFVFVHLLEIFREFSTRERKRAAIMERRTIDEAQGTARVAAAKARVGAVFDALTAERKLPKIVHEWLSRVWSSVLFRACLKEGTDSGVWRQHVLTARDLIWSVVAPMPESSVKMQRLLPALKQRLEEGAQSLSLGPGDRQRLLGGLEVLYRERQKLGERVECERERRTRERLVQELRREADSVLAIPVQEEVISVPPVQEIAQVDLDQYRESPPSQPALPEVEQIQQVVTKVAVTQLEALTPLPQGDSNWQQTYHLKDSWFLLRYPEKLPVRCRLAAIISDLDQFMFVNRQGAKVGVYSRLGLAHALRNQELLPLEQGPLFERAIAYVVGNCGESKISITV